MSSAANRRRFFRPFFSVSVFLLGLTACHAQSDAISLHASEPRERLSYTPPSNVGERLTLLGCSLRREGKYWCNIDFVRLANNSKDLDGQDVLITGFLAIERGDLAVYATEQDYDYKQLWRSVRIRGSSEQLKSVAAENLYRYVRIEGKYIASDVLDLRSGRLGSLVQPVSVARALPLPVTERPTIDEILIDYRDVP